MLVVLAVAIVAQLVATVAFAFHVERASKRAAEDIRHLTHLAISRHVGELRVLEPGATERPERSFVSIEGLN